MSSWREAGFDIFVIRCYITIFMSSADSYDIQQNHKLDKVQLEEMLENILEWFLYKRFQQWQFLLQLDPF